MWPLEWSCLDSNPSLIMRELSATLDEVCGPPHSLPENGSNDSISQGHSDESMD